jgi:hypothetical protein
MKPSEQEQQMNPGDMQKLRQEVIRSAVIEPPIEDSPYIHVVFCKGHNGWMPFTGYGCDISPKKTVEFINCINDAADVLNRKDD